MDANEKGLLTVIAKQLRDLRHAFTDLSKQPGPPGVEGKEGLRGPPGRDGTNGKPGAPGKDGRNGTDGVDGKDGRDGSDGTPGADGKDGADGDVGPIPKHQWQGTKLRFQQTAKRWGKWTDLKGPSVGGMVVASADGGSGFDPNSLPLADYSPTPTEIIVKQDGVWVRATWDQFLGWVGSVGPSEGVTVNGESVKVNGETVLVNGA